MVIILSLITRRFLKWTAKVTSRRAYKVGYEPGPLSSTQSPLQLNLELSCPRSVVLKSSSPQIHRKCTSLWMALIVSISLSHELAPTHSHTHSRTASLSFLLISPTHVTQSPVTDCWTLARQFDTLIAHSHQRRRRRHQHQRWHWRRHWRRHRRRRQWDRRLFVSLPFFKKYLRRLPRDGQR